MSSALTAMTAALLGVMLAAAHAGDYLRPAPHATWSERVQIVYQAETRSVARKSVRVWNPRPERNLDFVWEPAQGQPSDGIAADGTVKRHGPAGLAHQGVGQLRSQDDLQHV